MFNVLSVSSFLSQGVFIQLVQANSPAALAGLRFGDQVLQINGQNCAGWSVDKVHKALKAAAETRIELVVRDRWGVFDLLRTKDLNSVSWTLHQCYFYHFQLSDVISSPKWLTLICWLQFNFFLLLITRSEITEETYRDIHCSQKLSEHF